MGHCYSSLAASLVLRVWSSRYSSGPSRNWVKTKCVAWKSANANRHKLFEGHKKPPGADRARERLTNTPHFKL
jgi:hypothetical protein